MGAQRARSGLAEGREAGVSALLCSRMPGSLALTSWGWHYKLCAPRPSDRATSERETGPAWRAAWGDSGVGENAAALRVQRWQSPGLPGT